MENKKIQVKITKNNGGVTFNETYTWEFFKKSFHPYLVERFNTGTFNIIFKTDLSIKEFVLLD